MPRIPDNSNDINDSLDFPGCRLPVAMSPGVFPGSDNRVNAPGEDESEALVAAGREIKKPP